MNDIQIFNNEEFGAVRTTGTPEQPLSCLADVCKALGLKQGHVRERLDDGVVSTEPISDSLGRQQVANFVNEDGLYDVILDSRKPEAKRFRKWVTSEVLPTIRKHGAYMTQQTIEKALAEPDFLIQLAVNLKEERKKRLLAEQECEHQRTRIVELGSKVDDLQQEVTEMKDKVSYLDIILATKSSVLVTQIAQDYGESSIRFNRRLKDMNIQYQRGKQWILYADYKDCGYVTSETYLIKHKDGTEDVRMNTKWTQKGRRFEERGSHSCYRKNIKQKEVAMESISKIQLRLYATKRKNGKWQLEMSRMPKRISVIGRTPIVDKHYMPSDLQVVSMSKLHHHVGCYYGKIVKTLKEEGIITKEYGMWKLREDLQDKGIAVYVTGRMRCFYHFYLLWTPKGVEFIKEIINNRTRH